MNKLSNVDDKIRNQILQDSLASELVHALEGLFSISVYLKTKRNSHTYTVLYCKPTRTISESLLMDREVLCLLTKYADIDHRAIVVAQEIISASNGRLDPATAMIVHADSMGDEKLRTWGRQSQLKIISIFRSPSGALPSAEILKRNLANELFSIDPFQVAGPVIKDIDFFGRGNEALELLRQLQSGRIRTLFGIRKIGKTSLLNRVIKLARDAGTPQIAMIDCSIIDFNRLTASQALQAVAKVSRAAMYHGYAHIADVLRKTEDYNIAEIFSELWTAPSPPPLIIIFDEVDYITPNSPTSEHWQTDFNEFWREFRAIIQEAQRHNMTIALLVSGVSSSFFRMETIGGVENAALYFITEEYLSPFARGASLAMLKDLEKRCGFRFEPDARELICDVCGDFPFWIRMAGSHIHRTVDVDLRPVDISLSQMQQLLGEFLAAEGAEIARVALENMQRVYPDVIQQLRVCVEGDQKSSAENRLLVRYGLAKQAGMVVSVKSQMVKAGLELLDSTPERFLSSQTSNTRGPILDISEWAEELAIINRRRNTIERKLRDFVFAALKLSFGQKKWVDNVLAGVTQERRSELRSFTGDNLMDKLYWIELKNIITKNWTAFEKAFGDKTQFIGAMDILNERPDAHAKPVDLADVGLQKKYLKWLEEHIVN